MTLSIPTLQDAVPDSTPMASPGRDLPWQPEAFEQRLRGMESRYHIHHPFNQLLNSGQLQAHQVRGWIANRFYYQACIPMKDAAILSNCPDPAFRRRWIERLLDHDGRDGGEAGGIEAWIRLGQAAGIARESMVNFEHVLPAVRFAVDAYVNFARTATWQEAAISSLTELFAPKIHADRLAGWPQHYPWIAAEGLDYFRSRIPLASRDVEHGLEVAKAWCTTRRRQGRAVEILQFKLDVLWAMLDAIERAYPQAHEQEIRA